MSELILKMDTKTKEFSVALDGKTLEDVVSVSAFKRYHDMDGKENEDMDMCYLEISRRTPDEENGLVVCERICASEKGVETKKEVEKPAETQPTQVALDIAKFMNSQRKKK